MSRLPTFIRLFLLCSLLLTSTQAFDFKSLFGGSDGKASEEPPAPFGTIVVEQSKRSDIPCQNYICPDSDVCVKMPKDCPCSNVTDRKCMVGDWYTCIRGVDSCSNVL